MIELVGEHFVVAPAQRRDHADIRHVTGREQQRARIADEVARAPLRALVGAIVAVEQMRGACADAEARGAFTGRLDHSRIGREPEIIVGGE